MDKRVIGCHKSTGNRGRFGKTKMLRLLNYQVGARRRECAEAARRYSHDGIANLEVDNVFPDRHDLPGTLPSQRASIARVHAQRIQDVFEIQAGSVHLDLNLAASWFAARHSLIL